MDVQEKKKESLKAWEVALKRRDATALASIAASDPYYYAGWVSRAVEDAVSKRDVELALCIADAFPEYTDKEREFAVIGSTPGRGSKPISADNGATHVLSVLLSKLRSHLRKAGPEDPAVRALFDALVARDADVHPETLQKCTLEMAVYTTGGLPLVEILLEKAHVTNALVESAKYLCKRPANIPTPERRAILALVEGKYKAQQRARREELKRQRELEARAAAAADPDDNGAARPVDEPMPKRRATRSTRSAAAEQSDSNNNNNNNNSGAAAAVVGDDGGNDDPDDESDEEPAAPPPCVNLGTFGACSIAFPNLMENGKVFDIWSCGALVPGTEHAVGPACADPDTLAVRAKCETLNRQLASWRPDYDGSDEDWRSFIVRREVLDEHFGGADRPCAAIAASLLRLPIDGSKDEYGYSAAIKPMLKNRKTFFHNRWYYGGPRGVDTKKLAKTKAATNYFRSLVDPNDVVQIVAENKEMSTFGWGLCFVGKCKKIDGAVAVLVFTDCKQDHYHHGS